MAALIGLIIAIVIISAVVGAIAQFLNKLNEANAQPARRPPGGGNKQTDRDMDRFLAEIDRLRKKNAEAAQQQQQPEAETAARPPVAKPVIRPIEKQADRPRPRVVAELAEPQAKPTRRDKTDAQGFTVPPPPPPSLAMVAAQAAARPHDLPIAALVSASSLAEIPGMVRVAALSQRSRPAPKTNLAKNITNLLNSPQGAATAIVLMEILGPPKCKQQKSE